jgi:uncharacterized protein
VDLKLFTSLSEIAPSDWNALTPPHCPFSDYAFLRALEDSRAVSSEAGWVPLYLTAWNAETLVGALPLYLKNHSYGEYIFDWGWANAYAHAGKPYYPKLVSMVPFTPATGPKLLLRAGHFSAAAQLLKASRELLQQTRSTSLHFLFLPSEEVPVFEKEKFATRLSYQYHWHNRNYRSFSDFLECLRSRKKKQILKERKTLSDHIQCRWITGSELPAYARQMYQFYLSTIEKRGAYPYLNEDFFRRVFEQMPTTVRLLLALDGERPVAGSLFYTKGDSLFGRYWGAEREIPHLHFELCYYQGIEYAIEAGLRRFEAGAQGEHKLARGFLPQVIYSSHWIEDSSFDSAIREFIQREATEVRAFVALETSRSPYREQAIERGEKKSPGI